MNTASMNTNAAQPAVAAPPTLERVGDEVFLGRSLSGAECRLRLLARGRKPQVSRLGVFCAGRKAAAGMLSHLGLSKPAPAADTARQEETS